MLQHRFDIETKKKYNYIFSLFTKVELNKMLSDKEIIAEWDNIPLDMTVSHSPERYWKSIRKHMDLVKINQNVSKNGEMLYGVNVELHVSQKILPASIMKALLDGIICAFHQEDNIDKLIDRINSSSLVLSDDTMNLFGKRKYILSFQDGIKWNPADERIMFAWVSIIKEDCKPYISGRMYKF